MEILLIYLLGVLLGWLIVGFINGRSIFEEKIPYVFSIFSWAVVTISLLVSIAWALYFSWHSLVKRYPIISEKIEEVVHLPEQWFKKEKKEEE